MLTVEGRQNINGSMMRGGNMFSLQPCMALAFRRLGFVLDMYKGDQVGSFDGFFVSCVKCSSPKLQMGSRMQIQ